MLHTYVMQVNPENILPRNVDITKQA